MNPISAVIEHPPQFPPGFRARRGLNWAVVGLMYTSYYLCRYNFSYANKAIADQFHFSKSEMSTILSVNFIAYGCGQIINGLLTDRIGGKRAMLIGAAGTVATNLLFGVASFWGLLSLFALLWGINGYLQSFGSPGFIKINSAWFSEKQRGTFAGIFGFMINLGRFAANKLLPTARWLHVPRHVARAAAALAMVILDPGRCRHRRCRRPRLHCQRHAGGGRLSELVRR